MPPPTHTVPFVTVDAFTTRPFGGNPASVLIFPLNNPQLQELGQNDEVMQQIAAEFNLSETAFCTELDGGTDDEPRYGLRWRTPITEVPLCGHATLAAAYALFSDHHPSASVIRFETRFSGTLYARRARPGTTGDQDIGPISLDFPMASILVLSEGHRRLPKILAAVQAATGLGPDQVVRCAWYDAWEAPLVELARSVDLQTLAVDASALAQAGKLVVLTQPSSEPGYDIASRVFAAPCGIDEDPVTGSAHTALAPFWLSSGADALGRLPPESAGRKARTLRAKQVSRRSGEMLVILDEAGKRVELRGRAVRVMKGELEL